MLNENTDAIEISDVVCLEEQELLQADDGQNEVVVSDVVDEVFEESKTYELTEQSKLVEMDLGCDDLNKNTEEENCENVDNFEHQNSSFQGYSKLKGKTIAELEEYYNSIRGYSPVGVYVKTNAQGYITEVKSDFFDKNLEGYIKIDEGEGDRYVYAQSCYFEESLCDDNGQYRYKL